RYRAARDFLYRCDNRGIVKCDGSIGDGDSGIELVTLPLSLDAIRFLTHQVLQHNALGNAFADSSCGMHVHVSRGPLYRSQLANLVRFVHKPANYHFMEWMAGRELVGSRW